jgi:putative ABC transport system permease protein
LSVRYPADYSQPRAVVTPIRDHFLGPIKPALLILWGAVGLLLVMTCANIANLLLIRASDREEEMLIRKAMGVSPSRMLRQLLTESVLLASIGGVCGAALAWWGTAIVVRNGPASIPRLSEVAVDGRVLLYATAVTLLTGVIFGFAPARLLIGRRSGDGAAPGAGTRTTAGPGAWRYRASLIAVNVAMSAVLLVGSGLLVHSFIRLLNVEPGFQPAGVLTLETDPTGQSYATIPGITAYYDQLTSRVRTIHGVKAVSASTQLPLAGQIDRSGITVEGRDLANPAEAPEADRYAVRPDYFTVMQIPLLRGRLLTEADSAGALSVAVIGRTMAERLWPGEDPIGRRIRVAGGEGNPMRTIVGIVGDVRHYGLHVPESLQVYVPHAQTFYPESALSLVVRVADNVDPLSIAGEVRGQVRAIDALQPVTGLQTYDAIVSASMATRRFTLTLLGLFAATALLLAVVGLYGALAYLVTQRQRELGVRLALGAGAGDIARLVVEQGMRPTALGLAGGFALSLASGRVVENLLYGVTPRDLVTYLVVFGVIAASALVACAIPARRAAHVEPSVTLRAP